MGQFTRENKGFTLIEILITMAVVSIIMVIVIAAFNIQQKSQVKQQLIAEVQQNGRAAMYMLARDIRMTSFGLGDGEVSYNIGSGETNYKAIEIVDGGPANPDRIEILYATPIDLIDTGSGEVNALTTAQITFLGDELKVDNIDGFDIGDWVIITNNSYSSLLKVTGVDEATKKLDYDYDTSLPPGIQLNSLKGGGAGYGAGSSVYKLRYMIYDVSGTGTAHPVMRVDRDGPIGPLPFETIAEDVEDLQAVYVFEDGDTASTYNDADADTTNDYADIRAVRVSVLARTRVQNENFKGDRRPAIENRVQGPSDSYGRRLLTLELKIRNFGL